MSIPLTPEERLELAVLGWQAECACQHNATHLATSWRFAIGNDKMPDDAIACIDIGRKALRDHLAAVRGDPDRTTIETPVAGPTAPPLVTVAFEAQVTCTRKTGTRIHTTQLLVLSGPTDTTEQFLERVGLVVSNLARE